MGQESLRATLRAGTREQHSRLDTALAGPDGQVADTAAYVRIVRVMHALHSYADAPLARWATASPLAGHLPAALVPDRVAAYTADLRALGADDVPAAPPHGAQVPDSVDDARGLALLYVLAGSAVGARVLLRALPDTVPLEARAGLTDAASPASTQLWRSAQAVLSQPIDRDLVDGAVAEASRVFGLLLDRTELVAS